MRSLVVGFDEAERQRIETALEDRDHVPTVVGGAREAVQACRAGLFPLIIVDLDLPEVDYGDLLARLRTLPGGATSFVICGPPRTVAVDPDRILEAGANDFLARPIDESDLARRLAAAEQRLKTSYEPGSAETRFGHLLATSPAVIFSIRPGEDRATTFISRNVETLLGCEPRDFLEDERFWWQRIHPEDEVQMRGALERVCEEGHTRVAFRFRHRDGSWRWLSEELRCLTDEEGVPIEIVGSLLDETARRQAEEERHLLSRSVEQATEAVFITTPEQQIRYVNPAFVAITGYSSDEVIGRSVRMLRAQPLSEVDYGVIRDTLAQGAVWTGRIEIRRKDSGVREMEGSISPVRDDAGRLVDHVAVLRDATYEREMEDQVRQSQKLEAVGRLAGGIAHDFSNLLTAVGGHADLLLETFSESDPRRERVGEIVKATARATRLTRRLLTFSRRQPMEPCVLDVNKSITEMEVMLRRLLGENIELLSVLDSEVGRVTADQAHLEQVILNLALNARDSMANGGMLTIETAHVVLDERHSAGPLPVEAGSYMQLSVSDTGCGMDPETRDRIFEPFFTTKDREHGTGLGLSTVYGIVKQAGGGIWVYSEAGIGSTFKIYLPRMKEGEVEEPEPTVEAPDGTEVILLAEDEALVRNLTREMLEMRGYTVITAKNGQEALDVLEKTEADVDLLLTDVVMPEMNGPSLAEEVRARRPEIAVVFMSGYTDTAIVRGGVLDRGLPFLEKPFSQAALAKKVREALDERD